MPLILSAAQCFIHISRTFSPLVVCTVSINYAAIRHCIPTSKCLWYVCRIDFFFPQIKFQRTIKSSLSYSGFYSDMCLYLPWGCFLDKLCPVCAKFFIRKEETRQRTEWPSPWVRPPRCLRSAAFFSCICWIKWWRLASVASKKDFLSPAVVALPVEKKKRKNRGLKLGCGLCLRRRFCLRFFFLNDVFYSIICKK